MRDGKVWSSRQGTLFSFIGFQVPKLARMGVIDV